MNTNINMKITLGAAIKGSERAQRNIVQLAEMAISPIDNDIKDLWSCDLSGHYGQRSLVLGWALEWILERTIRDLVWEVARWRSNSPDGKIGTVEVMDQFRSISSIYRERVEIENRSAVYREIAEEFWWWIFERETSSLEDLLH